MQSLVAAFLADVAYAPAYPLAAACARRLGAEAEAPLFERAAAAFEEPERFYDLGYHFIDAGNERVAIPFLDGPLNQG